MNDNAADGVGAEIATAAAIDAAARILENGGLVAFPTETVYGLGADAENPLAVRTIYLAKGRPADHPLIVHLAAGADPGYWSSNVGALAEKLIAAFWPGPLTLILQRAKHVPDIVAGGQDTIGLRCPAHPVAQALLHKFKAGRGGLAAPSANLFGHVSPTTAGHVREEFHDAPLVQCVLEGGQSAIGIESTILDLSREKPMLLRPGGVSALQIAQLLGVMPGAPDAQAPRVPGALASHYAPRTPVVLAPGAGLAEWLNALVSSGRRVALMRHTLQHDADQAHTAHAFAFSITSMQMPAAPDAYAHALYAALRQLDRTKADVILVEALPDTDAWRAIHDRLARAACGSAERMSHLIR